MADKQSIGSAAAVCLAGKRVLVVEDTWVVAEALQSLLEETGLVVSGPSASVADAERLIREQVPQLAVVDVKLKGETAFDLIDCLHNHGVPVVVITGLGVDTFAALPQKANAIVQKPFSGNELIATLHHLVTRTPFAS
jgi:DNA-binding response OmpR family regulator